MCPTQTKYLPYDTATKTKQKAENSKLGVLNAFPKLK
jgi:hypothetical protein